MALEPDYGETLVRDEEAEALTLAARQILGDSIRKADLYDATPLGWHATSLSARTVLLRQSCQEATRGTHEACTPIESVPERVAWRRRTQLVRTGQ